MLHVCVLTLTLILMSYFSYTMHTCSRLHQLAYTTHYVVSASLGVMTIRLPIVDQSRTLAVIAMEVSAGYH